MNTAVAEAHDLGWKLAWVLHGWAGPGLLDSYEAEWRPVGARRAARSADPGPEASGAATLDPAFPLDLHALDHRTAATLAIDPDGALLARPDAQVVAHWPTAPTDPQADLAEAASGWFGRAPTANDQGRRPSFPPAGGSADGLPAREDREPGHAGMRTSTDASSGFASTSGTGLSSK
jgi:FAD binding domain